MNISIKKWPGTNEWHDDNYTEQHGDKRKQNFKQKITTENTCGNTWLPTFKNQKHRIQFENKN
jgi:hypothetical protein